MLMEIVVVGILLIANANQLTTLLNLKLNSYDTTTWRQSEDKKKGHMGTNIA